MLELGGKDPMIVCADADLDNAISGARLGRLRQRRPDLLGDRARLRRCARSPTASSRASSARRERLRLGDPLQWETEIGPMTSDGQYEIVVDLIDDAVASGATKLCGGADRGRRAAAASSSPRPC